MRPTLVVLLCLVLGSCRTAALPPEPPAPVHHVVLFTLLDPAQADDLLLACAEMGALPGSRGASAGKPLGTGRPDARGEWHVALHAAFANVAAYAAWREHPRHREVGALWKPRCREVRVIDWTGS